MGPASRAGRPRDCGVGLLGVTANSVQSSAGMCLKYHITTSCNTSSQRTVLVQRSRAFTQRQPAHGGGGAAASRQQLLDACGGSTHVAVCGLQHLCVQLAGALGRRRRLLGIERQAADAVLDRRRRCRRRRQRRLAHQVPYCDAAARGLLRRHC